MRRVPGVATFRGVEIHAYQDEARIRAVVVPEIDRVFEMEEPAQLFAFAGDQRHAPEARLLAARLLREQAATADAGRRRMSFAIEAIAAQTSGLSDLKWHDPNAYRSLLDAGEGAAPRPEPYRSELAAAQS